MRFGKLEKRFTAKKSGFSRSHPPAKGVSDLIVTSVGPQGEIAVGGLSDRLNHGGVKGLPSPKPFLRETGPTVMLGCNDHGGAKRIAFNGAWAGEQSGSFLHMA